MPLVSLLVGASTGSWGVGAAAQGSGISLPVERPVLELGLRTSATWSDNILLAPKGSEESDWLIEASPYLNARSIAPRATYNLFYQLRNFWRVGSGDTALARHALNGTGSFALVDDRLWVDLAGYMGNANLSATGPLAADPGASFVNTTRVRRFSISPWYRDRIGNFASYVLRYSLAHSAGDTGFALAKIDQRASASVDGIGDGSSPWNWRWYGEFQNRQFEGDITRNRRTSGVALFYRMNPDLRVFGSIDYEQIDELRNRDGDDFGYGPGGGFDWAPNERTSVGASVSKRYYGTVSNARASYSTASSTMGLQYSRSILSSSDASLLFFDPLSLTSGAVGAAGVDPVMTSLVNSGLVLPFGTSLTQSLVTDASVLDRRLTAFYGLRGARNSLTFSGWWSNRESTTELAATRAATGLRGSGAAGSIFVGELRERGLGASFQHRLDARSSINVGLNRRLTRSPTAGFESQLTTLSAGYITQLTSETSAFVGYRRARQTGEGPSAIYTENAVYGGVDMRFR